MLIAVDLDGTLLDGSHKAHLLTPPKTTRSGWEAQCFKAWTEASKDDKFIPATLAVVQALIITGHVVEFWTGRGENCREVTEAKLRSVGLTQPLRMRPMGQAKLADHVCKQQYIERYGKPDLILEDRVAVVKMWRKQGITCWQVAEGNY
jgi:hypothetical protein